MAPTLPACFAAGTTFNARAILTAYPASTGWALVAMLRGPGVIDINSAPDGNQHRFSVSALDTGAWQPGTYRYVIRAKLGDTVEEIDTGSIIIQPDAAALTPGTEIRTHAAIVLDNINAVLEKRASQDQQRYTINNRELWRTPIADLLLLRKTYIEIVMTERRKARGQSAYGRSVRIRFSNPR